MLIVLVIDAVTVGFALVGSGATSTFDVIGPDVVTNHVTESVLTPFPNKSVHCTSIVC